MKGGCPFHRTAAVEPGPSPVLPPRSAEVPSAAPALAGKQANGDPLESPDPRRAAVGGLAPQRAGALARVRVWHKLMLISLSFLLPIAVMFWLIVSSLNERIDFARVEQAGNEYQAALEGLLELVPQHQMDCLSLSEGVGQASSLTVHGAGGAGTVTDLSALETQIDEAFASLESVDARLGARLQFTEDGLAKRKRGHARVSTLKQEWQELKSSGPGLPPAVRTGRHRQLITGVRTMITHAGDTSNLILDPDLDSYYLMDATLLALPQTQDRLAATMVQGAEALRRGNISPRERGQLRVHAALLQEADLDRIVGSTQTSLNEDANFHGVRPALQTNVPPALTEFAIVAGEFIRLTADLAEAERATVTVGQFLAAGAKARAASFRFWHVARRELDGLLQERIDYYTRTRTRVVMLVLFTLAASGVFVFFMTRSISEPLRRQAEALAVANEGLRTEVVERGRAEESLRESEARVRAIVDTALDAVVTMDTTGRIVGWNSQAETIFGWKREEVLGQSLSQTIVPPQHREAHERGLKRFVASGHGPVLNTRIEITALRRDGREFDVELAITPLKTQGGLEFSAFLRDISERKRAEAELARAQQELLNVSRQAGMAEIATGVLHNVGNVLNSVNVSANLVSDQVRKTPVADLSRVVALLREQGANLGAFFTSDPRGPKVAEFLAQVAEKFTRQQESQLTEVAALQKNIEHIKDIVAMQQSYAKVSGLTENLSPVELIEDALRMNAGSFQKHEVELVRELPADLPRVCVDKHKVLQILVNLLRNAKHACDDAGREDKRITVRAVNENDRVRITITDNGVGIPPENLTRIFNHGFTTKKTGHGFGLHSAANAAKEMGGGLTVHSEGAGHGATFTLELPAAAAGRRQIQPAPSPHIAA